MNEWFTLLSDEDGHWYVVPLQEIEKFYEWLDGVYAGANVPQPTSAVRVDGPYAVSFTEWRRR